MRANKIDNQINQWTFLDGSEVARVHLPPGVTTEAQALSWYEAHSAELAPGYVSSTAVKATFQSAIQAYVDGTAKAKSYEDGNSCASYASSTNEQWAAEAAAFIAWRDSVWTYCYAELAKVEAGTREQPSIEAFLGELPTISWPSV